jgi:hypothetical protein
MNPLKKPNLRRCFNFPAHETYAKYASFQENFAPCIPGFFSRIMLQAFCSVINYLFIRTFTWEMDAVEFFNLSKRCARFPGIYCYLLTY